MASKIDVVNLHGVFTASRLSSCPPQGGLDSLCLTSGDFSDIALGGGVSPSFIHLPSPGLPAAPGTSVIFFLL